MQPDYNNSGPAFLCCGPPKTGTSWLYWNLYAHPDVDLPPVKEIRYFLELEEQLRINPVSVWYLQHWHVKTIRGYARHRFAAFARNPLSVIRNRRRLCWDFKYIFKSHTDAWYQSLFDGFSGDISPGYYTLCEHTIHRAARVTGNIPVLFLLRHPADRLWSHAKMSLGRFMKRDISAVPSEELYLFLKEQHNLCPSYVQMVQKWQAAYGKNNVKAFDYHRISDEPACLLSEVCRFIGLDSTRFSAEHVTAMKKRFGAGRRLAPPPPIADYLTAMTADMVRETAEVFPEIGQKWLAASSG